MDYEYSDVPATSQRRHNHLSKSQPGKMAQGRFLFVSGPGKVPSLAPENAINWHTGMAHPDDFRCVGYPSLSGEDSEGRPPSSPVRLGRAADSAVASVPVGGPHVQDRTLRNFADELRGYVESRLAMVTAGGRRLKTAPAPTTANSTTHAARSGGDPITAWMNDSEAGGGLVDKAAEAVPAAEELDAAMARLFLSGHRLSMAQLEAAAQVIDLKACFSVVVPL